MEPMSITQCLQALNLHAGNVHVLKREPFQQLWMLLHCEGQRPAGDMIQLPGHIVYCEGFGCEMKLGVK